MNDMSKLKITAIDDDKPVTLTIKLPATVHRDLISYARLLKREGGQDVDPAMLVSPMLEKFMKSDRGFRKAKNQT